MKKILSFVVMAVIMVSCYDDGELRNLISNTNQELANLTDRVEDLEDWQENVNAQIKTLQGLVENAEAGKVITNVQETLFHYRTRDNRIFPIKSNRYENIFFNSVYGHVIFYDTDGTESV